MWTSLSTQILTLAGYALTAGLLVYGLIVGIRVAKSVFSNMAGIGEYEDDGTDERVDAQLREMFGEGQIPDYVGTNDREQDYHEFGQDEDMEWEED